MPSGSKTKVLIVDDSSVFRLTLGKMLEEEPDVEVVGTASNGEIALKKLEQGSADLVLLDVEMPVMDGIACLGRIRAQNPSVKVIMVSALTAKGADTTLDAIGQGADDYVLKPASQGPLPITPEEFKKELLAKIRAFFAPPLPAVAPSSIGARALTTMRPKIVAVGSSTGGPVALEKLLEGLGRPLPVPMLITQHMPPLFTKQLAASLARKSSLSVIEGAQGMPIEVGRVYIAPGDYHMVLAKRGDQLTIDLNQSPPENYCRPSVDVMFRSIAQHFGAQVLAVQLTGMGHDGKKGAAEIVAKGGVVCAQDRASSVVWSMPSSVIEAGLASLILPPGALGAHIASRFFGSTSLHPALGA